jgi:hypothetical protein
MTDWIVIKAISDWGFGKAKTNRNQKPPPATAAGFVAQMIDSGYLDMPPGELRRRQDRSFRAPPRPPPSTGPLPGETAWYSHLTGIDASRLARFADALTDDGGLESEPGGARRRRPGIPDRPELRLRLERFLRAAMDSTSRAASSCACVSAPACT